MKTAITFLLLSLGLSAFAGNFSTYPAATAVRTNDLFLVDSNTSGSTYVSHTATGGVVLNMVSNALSAGMSISNGAFYNGAITNSGLDRDTVVPPPASTPPWTVLSGTNGNNWFVVNCTSTQFTNLGLFDTLNYGNSQFMITGITNANQTIAVIYNVDKNYTNAPFTWYPANMPILDTIPRRVGALAGGGNYCVSSYSINNNGGVPGGIIFGDGFGTATIVNNSFGLALSVGIAYGAGYGGNQFWVEPGSEFGSLVVKADNSLAIRGPITNAFGNNIAVVQPFTAPSVSSGYFQATNSSVPSSTYSLTASGTNGNQWILVNGSGFTNVHLFDELQIGSQASLLVVGVTNANQTFALMGSLNSTFTGSSFNIYPATFASSNAVFNRTTAISSSGSLAMAAAQVGNNSFNSGIVIADGATSLQINTAHSTPSYATLSYAGAPGGFGSQIVIQQGSTFNDLVIQTNDFVYHKVGVLAGHYGGTAAPYLIVTNAGAGSATGTVTLDAGASDSSGLITLTTGSSPAANSSIFTLTFINSFLTAPHVQITPANQAAAELYYQGYTPWASATTTTLSLNSSVSALSSSTVYKWFYQVMQ